jgi:hypothetical protein
MRGHEKNKPEEFFPLSRSKALRLGVHTLYGTWYNDEKKEVVL